MCLHKGQRGQPPHEPGERRCKIQRMPWHGSCPVLSSMLKIKQPEMLGVLAEMRRKNPQGSLPGSPSLHPMHPKISQPLLLLPQPSRAVLPEQSHCRVTLMSSTIFLAWAMVTASSSSSFSTSLRNLPCWACRHEGQTLSFIPSHSGTHRIFSLSLSSTHRPSLTMTSLPGFG